MILKHVDAKDIEHVIGEYDTVEDASKAIGDWCKKYNFVSYYQRWADFGDYLWCDFGNHVCFFRLYKDGDKKCLTGHTSRRLQE